MGEYQYYEFLAIDRALNERQLMELRALSSRAHITPTGFINTYHWGDFQGDPIAMMERYFDTFLYYANWNTRQVVIRLPERQLSIETATRYCVGDAASAWGGDAASAWRAGEHVVVSLFSESQGEGWSDEDGEGRLASIVPIRADLAAGDLRALYLGWLLSVQSGDLRDDDVEPPVPAKLGDLTASLRSLVDFLRIDEDLLAIAAEGSEGADGAGLADDELARALDRLAAEEKNTLLWRFVRGDGVRLRADLIRRLRAESSRPAPAAPGRRTVAELTGAVNARRGERERVAGQTRPTSVSPTV